MTQSGSRWFEEHAHLALGYNTCLAIARLYMQCKFEEESNGQNQK